MTSGATIKGEYRYELWREFREGDEPLRTVVFVMLNPSTADATEDDATIRRCVGFAKRWGFNRLVVVNLFAYRATDPKEIRAVDDPIGPENDAFIEKAVSESYMVIVAWGNNAVWPGMKSKRHEDVIRMITRHTDVYCLGKTRNGQPCHPVRLRGDLEPMGFAEMKRGAVPETVEDADTKPIDVG